MAFTDNFNRANENLEASANWTHDGFIAGALQVRTNSLSCMTTNSTGSAYQCPDQGSADHYVQFTARSVANSGPFACCRLADRSNFVGIRNNFENLEVYRRVAGSLTLLHTSAQGIGSGSTVRLECEGTNWRAFVAGVQVASGAIGSAGLTSQRQGLIGRTTTAGQDPWIDDFEAGPLGAVGITGTLAATETGSDATAMAGSVAVTGALAATESGADAAAASGAILVQGSLTAAETGADTASASGGILVAGSMATTETGDAAAIVGGVVVSGALAAVETGSDTFVGRSASVATPIRRTAMVATEVRAASVMAEVRGAVVGATGSRDAVTIQEKRTASVLADSRTAMVV